MARPSEKAQSALNRYLREQEGGGSGRRPALASSCDNLADAVKWRSSVERDIRLRVSEVQHAGHGAARLRELNDAINRLLRARRHWHKRVVELGGRGGSLREPDSAAFTHGGYRYFGAARDLPEVRDLVSRAAREREEADAEEDPAEMYARLNDAYYNPVYDDEDEAALVGCEKKLQSKLKTDWKSATDSVWDDSFMKYIGQTPKNMAIE